jgi:hypothetical protein
MKVIAPRLAHPVKRREIQVDEDMRSEIAEEERRSSEAREKRQISTAEKVKRDEECYRDQIILDFTRIRSEYLLLQSKHQRIPVSLTTDLKGLEGKVFTTLGRVHSPFLQSFTDIQLKELIKRMEIKRIRADQIWDDLSATKLLILTGTLVEADFESVEFTSGMVLEISGAAVTAKSSAFVGIINEELLRYIGSFETDKVHRQLANFISTMFHMENISARLLSQNFHILSLNAGEELHVLPIQSVRSTDTPTEYIIIPVTDDVEVHGYIETSSDDSIDGTRHDGNLRSSCLFNIKPKEFFGLCDVLEAPDLPSAFWIRAVEGTKDSLRSYKFDQIRIKAPTETTSRIQVAVCEIGVIAEIARTHKTTFKSVGDKFATEHIQRCAKSVHDKYYNV